MKRVNLENEWIMERDTGKVYRLRFRPNLGRKK